MNSNPQRRDNVLADAFEAVTAALLFDAGEEIVHTWLLKVLRGDNKSRPKHSFKI